MIRWIKPSGILVETNDLEATVLKAIELGWKRCDEASRLKRKHPRKKQVVSDGEC